MGNTSGALESWTAVLSFIYNLMVIYRKSQVGGMNFACPWQARCARAGGYRSFLVEGDGARFALLL